MQNRAGERNAAGVLPFASLWREARAGIARIFPLAGAATGGAAAIPGIWPLFLVFVKIGSIVFGSGYVLLAFLRADLVLHRAWVTDAQLVDAVAIGQVTPGPVFTTATFLGYLLRGPLGALAATIGIFLPAFVLVAISGPLVPLLRRSAAAGGISGRSERGIAGIDGGGQLPIGPLGHSGLGNADPGGDQRGAAATLSSEFRVASAGRRGDRNCHSAGARWLTKACCKVSPSGGQLIGCKEPA